MKTIQFPFLCLLLITVFCCNNDSDDDGVSAGDGCSASWTVDGDNYNENDMTLCVFLDNTLNLSSSTTGGDFHLQVDPITSTGNFIADPTDLTQTTFISIKLNEGTQIVMNTGQINVTELSNSKARGTFSGTFFDVMDVNQTTSFTVTNGQFEADF